MDFSFERLSEYIENKEWDLAKREIDFYKQTEEIGFNDGDLWNLDFTMARFIYPRLKRFKEEYNVGHPGSLTEEQWADYLEKMVAAFEILASEDNTCIVTNEQQDKKIKKGLKLFAKYFRALWI